MDGIVATGTAEGRQAVLALQAALEAGADFSGGLESGAALHADGMPEAALAAFEAVAAREPGNLAAWHAVATLRFQLDRPQAALLACNAALGIAPNDSSSLFNTGVVLAALGDAQAALHCYQRVLEIDPLHRGVLLNCPQLLVTAGRLPEALATAEAARAGAPVDADFAFNLGEVLITDGRFAEAHAAYVQAAGLRPEETRFAISAAVALAACGEVAAARADLDRLKEAHPAEFPAFRSPLRPDATAAFPELEAGRIALIAAYESYRTCDWSQREKFIDLFKRQVDGADGAPTDNPDLPFLGIALPIPGEIRLTLARNVARRISASVAGQTLIRNKRSHGGKLRIGYLSGDFRQHATSFLMSRLPGLHDRERFEVFVYSSGPGDDSAWRAEIINGADSFCEVGHFSALATAQRIAFDGIDLLVDLSGYTLHARSASLALRPAPVQLSYLTYLQTSGAPWIDYVLLDRAVLPSDERPNWQEQIAYLPNTLYLCDDRPTPACEPVPRSLYGLPEDAFVFCCLNAPWKIDPDTFACWMSILQRVPQSVLWLYDDTERSCSNLRRTAGTAGIDPQRLIFSPRMAHAEHIARFRSADLFLDTFSCNAHTTCIEALAAGLPVLTFPGQTVVERVAASLLAAHGVPELITQSRAAYVETACRLAEDTALLQAVQQRVSDRSASALFCTERRVREIERAYEMMWERYLSGLPAADFDVPPVLSAE
jgi:tetratricopeptide (TPR) repeat protein